MKTIVSVKNLGYEFYCSDEFVCEKIRPSNIPIETVLNKGLIQFFALCHLSCGDEND